MRICSQGVLYERAGERGLYRLASEEGPHVRTADVMVAHPALEGIFKKTHPCVLHVPCPHCGSAVGVLCAGSNGGWIAQTHFRRRDAFADARRAAGSKCGGAHRQPRR